MDRGKARKLSIQIAAAALLLILCCLFYRLYIGNTVIYVTANPGLAVHKEWQAPPEELEIRMEKEGIVEAEEVRISEEYMEIRLRAVSPGSTECVYSIRGAEDTEAVAGYEVSRTLSIICDGQYFTGLEMIILAVGLFLGVVCVLLVVNFFRIKGSGLYSYTSIFMIGLAIFCGAGSVGIIRSFLAYLGDPYYYGLPFVLDSIWAIPNSCLVYLRIPLFVFSIAMVISNIELLRHERFRLANILGILIPVFMVLGEALPALLSLLDYSGSYKGYMRLMLVMHVYITVFVYFECILAGSVICGMRAVRQKVGYDKDYIIILGCRFRKDGTLTPLLKGRCDRAIAFWKGQKQELGKEAVMIPSGGQGPDEVMPEARAMARYLMEEGIPEKNIICEDQSKNTYQNMLFSKKIIDAGQSPSRTVFSTTNYHIFRSGVWASQVGLAAEGIGSSTKWWFWPNAFMRECIGLLANRIRQEIVLLIFLVLGSVGLMYLLVK